MFCELPDVSEYLLYFPRFADPTRSTGLWFVDNCVDVQAIQTNACCLHLAGEWGDIDRCIEFFSAFRFLVVAIPDEGRRKEAVEQLRRRVRTIPITVVQTAGFRGKTLPQIMEDGLEAHCRLLGDCIDVPAYGLLNLADVQRPPGVARVRSGFAELDRAIGGFADGELSIWTGKRGEGKSTILGQVLLAAREQGRTVCAYSGELPGWRFKEWLYLQAAGPDNLRKNADAETGREYYTVPPDVQTEIGDWFDRRVFLLDNRLPDANSPEQILSAFRLAERQNGASVFLADNLMSAEISAGSDTNYFRAQSGFVGKLVAFCKATGAHVHLVSHPKKKDGAISDADDVSGTGEITNRADNVLALKRLPDEEADRQGYTALLSVLKNRQYGSRARIGMTFDEPSRRFSGRASDAIHHRYPWNTKPVFTAVSEQDCISFE